eukprot:CAMPEP_0197413518 /NCGR_PEP_ID=MMETSP1170-20131217/368_1 /TAXON_ID=54406 /ORGANISM="Sarcinochrysis sp, Strain CCMP770" /LENGTH=220 /DNA_ID=CAMNT_0042940107 /DNA_START=181 /DNA_END=840 /DNA_ORIENTATION=+
MDTSQVREEEEEEELVGSYGHEPGQGRGGGGGGGGMRGACGIFFLLGSRGGRCRRQRVSSSVSRQCAEDVVVERGGRRRAAKGAAGPELEGCLGVRRGLGRVERGGRKSGAEVADGVAGGAADVEGDLQWRPRPLEGLEVERDVAGRLAALEAVHDDGQGFGVGGLGQGPLGEDVGMAVEEEELLQRLERHRRRDGGGTRPFWTSNLGRVFDKAQLRACV